MKGHAILWVLDKYKELILVFMCGPLIVLLKDNPKQLYEHMHVKVRVHHNEKV